MLIRSLRAVESSHLYRKAPLTGSNHLCCGFSFGASRPTSQLLIEQPFASALLFFNSRIRDRRLLLSATLFAAGLSAAVPVAKAQESYTAFESAHVRPLALSQSGGRLYAVNTPDNRLAVYDTGNDGVKLVAEIPVGLEPVAVAVRNNEAGRTEAWVVNHLSDSISIVEIADDPKLSRVSRTLLVGDEPRDIVFAGADHARAFITTARRGQNRPGDLLLTTPGAPRADIWVFDAKSLGAPLGGTPMAILELFGDTPRALAASPDGKTVYAAVFASGNQTTTIPQPVVSDNGGLPPAPEGATEGAPEVGLIVKYDGMKWADEIERDWSPHVPFALPDYDVFRIDATANPPVESGRVSGVGTVLYNMAVRPSDGRLMVTNTEALNQVRFETALNGRFAPNQITVVSGTTREHIVHINPHIDYGHETGSVIEVMQSLATPMQIEFSPDGKTAYVAAFGSAKVGMFDAEALTQGRSERRNIDVGMGPTGLALDSKRDRLYVMNRLDHSISVIDDISSSRPYRRDFTLPYSPEPRAITDGRRFLYDASYTSGHGDVSCHSCHLFGDVDHLSWDLGNPFGKVTENPNTRNPAATSLPGGLGGLFGPGGTSATPFHPMKGPMTTQSLRGLAGAGPMHWRGDKTGGLTQEGNIDPEGDSQDENAAFLRFNAAFTGLQGRAEVLSEAEMQAFADFVLQLRYPPNPIKRLDNTDSDAEAKGRNLFIDNDLIPLEDEQACASCHVLPLTTNGTIARTAQVSSEQADFKIAHLRNVYQKVGMFGAANGAITGTPETLVGDQVRGFGLTHDGSISDLATFLRHPQNIFTPIPNQNGLSGDEKRRNVAQFILSMDTGLRPVVGQQVTITHETFSDEELRSRLNLLIDRAEAGDADLIVKGVWGGSSRGALYVRNSQFRTDKAGESTLSSEQLIALLENAAASLTFTAVPPGNGTRIGIDRNLDGTLDADERSSTTPSAEVDDQGSGQGFSGGAMTMSLMFILFGLGLLRRDRIRLAGFNRH